MYLHIGNGFVVRKDEVLGVFDLDNTSQSHLTRKYLAAAEKAGDDFNAAGDELPKSFIVCGGSSGQRVFLSQLGSATLLRRCDTQVVFDF